MAQMIDTHYKPPTTLEELKGIIGNGNDILLCAISQLSQQQYKSKKRKMGTKRRNSPFGMTPERHYAANFLHYSVGFLAVSIALFIVGFSVMFYFFPLELGMLYGKVQLGFDTIFHIK